MEALLQGLTTTLNGLMAALVLLGGCVAAAAYIPRLDHAASMRRSLIKTLPAALFALAASLLGGPWWLTVGLALSAFGDAALSRENERGFLIGLIGFALAHLAYLFGFALDLPAALSALPLWPSLLLITFGLSAFLWLDPYTGDLQWPVRVYVGLILAMVLCAWAVPGAMLVAFGALLFLISDSVLALARFRLEGRMAGITQPTVWVTYALAQLFITLGVLAFTSTP